MGIAAGTEDRLSTNRRLYFVASNPLEWQELDFREELHRIEWNSAGPRPLEISAKWAISEVGLAKDLATIKPEIVHVLAPTVQNRSLVVSDAEGNPRSIGSSELANVFAADDDLPKMVFINTCDSIELVDALAPSVGCVVAIDGLINDPDAINLADQLYMWLGRGESVAGALDRARSLVPGAVGAAAHPGVCSPDQVWLTPPEKGQPPPPPTVEPGPSVRLFVSYAHEDEPYKDALEKFLVTARRTRHLKVWHDRAIRPGDDWAERIDRNLEMADVVVLLVSVDFLNSEYCVDVEFKRALEREDEGETSVVPILIRECPWQGTPLAKLSIIPRDAKPISGQDPDKAWTAIAAELEKVISARVD